MKVIITGTKEGEQYDLYPKGSIHEVIPIYWKEELNGYKDSRGHLSSTLKLQNWYGNGILGSSKKCPCGCELTFSREAVFIPSPEDGKVLSPEDGKVLIALRCFERKYIAYREQYRKAIREEMFNEIKITLNE